MSTNEEVIKFIVDDYESIEKLWSPYALVYNALKVGSIDGTDIIPHDRAIARAQEADYKSNKKVKGKPECTIFIGRLAKITDSMTLKKVFGNYGAIKRCRLVEDIVTGSSKGYAFIEYETESSAAAAYKYGHSMNLDGKQIIVDYECERLLPGWVPRRLGGGFCGRKESGQLRFGCRCKPFVKPINLMTEEDLLERSVKGGKWKDDYNQGTVNERHNVSNKSIPGDNDHHHDRSNVHSSSLKERYDSPERRRKAFASHDREDHRRSERHGLVRRDRPRESVLFESKKLKRDSGLDRKRSEESDHERRPSHKKKSKDRSVKKKSKKSSHRKKKKKRHSSPKDSCNSSDS